MAAMRADQWGADAGGRTHDGGEDLVPSPVSGEPIAPHGNVNVHILRHARAFRH
jgi:hypothetical protein